MLLYELLTGTTPFDRQRFKEAGFDEMRRIIREEDPPKPSTRISTLGRAATTASANRKSDPRQLSRLVRGELDWIVMKALEKDRDRRYETASAFAADVQHYLHDEPVLACPPSAWYRLRKFARRNKARLLVTAGAGGVVLVGLLTVAGHWYQRHQRLEVSSNRVRKLLDDARGLLADDRLNRAHQALAEAKGQIGDDRDPLDSLADEVEALESEVERFEKFFALLDRGFQAEFPYVNAEVVWGESSLRRKPAPPARNESARRSGLSAPLLLEALSLYAVTEQPEWISALERGFLGAEQKRRVRQAVYEALLWLGDELLVWRVDHRTGQKLSGEAAGRLGIEYLREAEAARAATPSLFRLRGACRRLLKEEKAAQADEQRAAQTPSAIALDHLLLGHRAFLATDKGTIGTLWGPPITARGTGKRRSRRWRSRWSCARAATAPTGSFWRWPIGNWARRKQPPSGSTRPSNGWTKTPRRMRSCAASGRKRRNCWGKRNDNENWDTSQLPAWPGSGLF